MSTQTYAPKIPSGVGAYTLRQKKKKKSDALEPRLAHSCRSFCSMKRLGVFLLPLDGMLVHRGSLPNNLPVPIYTPGWREAL